MAYFKHQYAIQYFNGHGNKVTIAFKTTNDKLEYN